ncbi:MAG: hypothetical protein BAJALOKI3v1_100024 [Promethearchaeota archaeon]|nr:MAG: hypothetical protein BAJALOKI3v1_100024 [Candidatus Lokiarchaeota archaeon]
MKQHVKIMRAISSNKLIYESRNTYFIYMNRKDFKNLKI